MLVKKCVVVWAIALASIVFTSGCDAVQRGVAVGVSDGLSGGISGGLETLISDLITSLGGAAADAE